jgi:hypothetical protein
MDATSGWQVVDVVKLMEFQQPYPGNAGTLPVAWAVVPVERCYPLPRLSVDLALVSFLQLFVAYRIIESRADDVAMFTSMSS